MDEEPYVLFTFPRDDTLFPRLVGQEIQSVRRGVVQARIARVRIQRRYPRAVLLRQGGVLIQGVPHEIWLAFRDGREQYPPRTDRPWWTKRGVAHAIIHESGRVTRPNEPWKRLRRKVGSRHAPTECGGLLPMAACEDILRPTTWLRSMHSWTSTAELRGDIGKDVHVEYHVVLDADGSGQHSVDIRDFDERDNDTKASTVAGSALQYLGPGRRRMLMDEARQIVLPGGQQLPASIVGQPWAVLVVAGVVRVHLSTETGDPSVLYGGPGAFLGTHSTIDARNAPVGRLQAVTPSVLLQLNAHHVRQCIDRDAGFERAVADETLRRLRELVRVYAARSASSLAQRLAQEVMLLVELQPGELLLQVTEQQLASDIGSIRESVGRAVAQLRLRGALATTRYGLLVLNLTALRTFADVGLS